MVCGNSFEERKLLYEVSVRDIEFFKRQQWQISYYTIALYAAILGWIYGAPACVKPQYINVSLAITVVIMACFAIKLLSHLEHDIAVRRARLKSIRKKMPFLDKSWHAKKKEKR